MRHRFILVLPFLLILLASAGAWWALHRPAQRFDERRAYQDVITQVAFGPRIPGTSAHDQIVEWMQTELRKAGWQSRIEEAQMLGHPIRNIVAYRSDTPPTLILGAHYDTRIYADHDPDPEKRLDPVPGADDGASGVAVLLELARTLPPDSTSIWLVFFDAEDNGNIPGWDWLLGSRAFIQTMTDKPEAMILLDMVGDANLNIYLESQSDKRLASSIWDQAAKLGYGEQFIPQTKYSILDDHVPFIEAGIPAVDIIDIEYPYWHTTADMPDKVSPHSLRAVGETLLAWVASYERIP
jgi:glutaminyl-peptide cyclotransferase